MLGFMYLISGHRHIESFYLKKKEETAASVYICARAQEIAIIGRIKKWIYFKVGEDMQWLYSIGTISLLFFICVNENDDVHAAKCRIHSIELSIRISN